MAAAITKWMTDHPDLSSVCLLLLLIMLVSLICVLWSHWVAPKISAIDELQKKVGHLEGVNTSFFALKPVDLLSSLSSRISSIEGANDADRKLLQQQLESIEKAVAHSIGEMKQLQKRNEGEIQKMQSQHQYVWAIEQASQDVILAEIAEQLARLAPNQHPAALKRLENAKERLSTLQFANQHQH
jgi:hypothetical protein